MTSYEVPSSERTERRLRKSIEENRQAINFSPTFSTNADQTAVGAGSKDYSTGVTWGGFVLHPESHIISIQLSWTGATGTLEIGDIVDTTTNAWQGKFLHLVSGNSAAGTGVFEPQNTTAFSDVAQTLNVGSTWTGATYTTSSSKDGGIVIQSASVIIDTIDSSAPTLNTIFGAKADGQFTTIKPKEGLTLTIATGGNIDISSNETVEDTTFVVAQFHEDNITPDSNGSWSLVSGASGGSSGNAIKQQVRVATTGNNVLHPIYNEVIDGVTTVEGDRILVKEQTTVADNGIYVMGAIVASAGTITRATDFDNDSEVLSGVLVVVEEGTVNADKIFMLTTNNPIVVGTTSLVFSDSTFGDNLGNHTATESLKMADNAVFLDTATLFSILHLSNSLVITANNAGADISFFVNDLGTPVSVITETSFNINQILSMAADIDLQTQDMINIDRLLFDQAAGSTLSNTSTGITSDAAKNMNFNVADTGTFVFTENGVSPAALIINSTSLLSQSIIPIETTDDVGTAILPWRRGFFDDITLGGALKGIDDMGELIFVNNTATPAGNGIIFFDGTDLKAKTGSTTVNLTDISGGNFTDAVFRVHDEINLTADFKINLDGASNTFSATLDFNQTADRVYTYPDATTTLAGLNIANIFTENQKVAKVNSQSILTLFRSDSTPTANDVAGDILFNANTTGAGATERTYAKITAIQKVTDDATRQGQIQMLVADTNNPLTTYVTLDGDTQLITFSADVSFNGFNIDSVDNLKFQSGAGDPLTTADTGFGASASGGLISTVLSGQSIFFQEEVVTKVQMDFAASTVTLTDMLLTVLETGGDQIQLNVVGGNSINSNIDLDIKHAGTTQFTVESTGITMGTTKSIKNVDQIGFTQSGTLIEDDTGGMILTVPPAKDFNFDDGTSVFATLDKDLFALQFASIMVPKIAIPADPPSNLFGKITYNTATNRLNFRRRNDADSAFETIDLEGGGSVAFPIEPTITDNGDGWSTPFTLDLDVGDGHIFKWTVDQSLTFASGVSNTPANLTQRTFELEFEHDEVGGTFTVTLPSNFVDDDGVTLASFNISTGTVILSCRINDGTTFRVLQKNIAVTSVGTPSPLTTKGDVWGYDSTDNRIPIGTNGNFLIADSAQTLGLKWGNELNAPVIIAAPLYNDGIKQIFNPNVTNAGINVGAQAGDVSAPVNGDIVYNSSTNTFRFREATAWVELGGEVFIWTATHDANGNTFILDADGDTSIEASTDNIIVFKAGGTDQLDIRSTGMLMSSNLAWSTTGNQIDFNSNTLILDADGDTSIDAADDDIIDFNMGGQAGEIIFQNQGEILWGRAGVQHKITPSATSVTITTGVNTDNFTLQFTDSAKTTVFTGNNVSTKSDSNAFIFESLYTKTGILDGDGIASYQWNARTVGGTPATKVFAQIVLTAEDVTTGTEDSKWALSLIDQGDLDSILSFQGGILKIQKEGNNAELEIIRNESTTPATGTIGAVIWKTQDANNNLAEYGDITVQADDITAGNETSTVVINGSNDGIREDFINYAGGVGVTIVDGSSSSDRLGFFNATPVVRQTGVAVTAAAIHAALVAFGLITA